MAFYTTWKSLFVSIFIVGTAFITWDILFTFNGVWRFNHDYVMGVYFAGLPLEEWLFFVIVPYACVFIYECIRVYLKNYFSAIATKAISFVLIALNILMIMVGDDKLYTVVNSVFCILILVYMQFVLKWEKLNLFYVVYSVCLLPFVICNGILTSLPILIYDNSRNLAIRTGTIPIEDFFYNFSMLILWCFFYEKFRNLNKRKA